MKERAKSSTDPLEREIRDSLKSPARDVRGKPSLARAALIVLVMLVVGGLLYLAMTIGTKELEPKRDVVRETIAPKRLYLKDPDKAIKERMHELVAPVVQTVSGTAGPALSPEEIARLEYLAYQIGGPIRVDTDRASSRAVFRGSGHTSPPTTQATPLGTEAAERRRNEYDAPTISSITATVHPTTLWGNDNRVLEGKRMTAILETPIDTTLPGPVRAVFTEDVYAESGDRILIPKYSEALGTTGNVRIQSGQDRVGVIWHRLLLRTKTGDGIVEVKLDSSATDHLGRAGVRGNVETHFWEKFGYALLYSLIGATASNVSTAQEDRDNAQQRYLEATTDSFRATSQESLRAQDVHDPTITVPRATPITIVAAKDILFHGGQVEGVR